MLMFVQVMMMMINNNGWVGAGAYQTGGDEYDASPSLLLESHSIPPTFVRQILTKSTFCNKK